MTDDERGFDLVFNGEPLIADVTIPVPLHVLTTAEERDELRTLYLRDFEDWMRSQWDDIGRRALTPQEVWMAGASVGARHFYDLMLRKRNGIG